MGRRMIETELISSDLYHSLPGESNSKISVFIEDPRLYHYQFLSGRFVQPKKDHFDFGAAVHEICLLGASNILVIPSEVLASNGARSGNAWKNFQSENADKILLKQSDYNAVMRCVEEIRSHPIAGQLLESPGYTERMYQANVDGLLVRCRPDKLCVWNGRNVVVDLKTTTDTTPNKFVKSIERFGYHRQEYIYRKVLESDENQVQVDAFIFVAVNDSEPHCVDCYELTEEWLDYARKEVDPAINDLRRRHAEDDWKSTTINKAIRISPPDYMRFKGQYKV